VSMVGASVPSVWGALVSWLYGALVSFAVEYIHSCQGRGVLGALVALLVDSSSPPCLWCNNHFHMMTMALINGGTTLGCREHQRAAYSKSYSYQVFWFILLESNNFFKKVNFMSWKLLSLVGFLNFYYVCRKSMNNSVYIAYSLS